MIKLRFHVERTNGAYLPRIREGRLENILENSLLKVISASAKQRVELKTSESYAEGAFLGLNNKIAIAS